jgi:hypothetical protein
VLNTLLPSLLLRATPPAFEEPEASPVAPYDDLPPVHQRSFTHPSA